MRKQLKVLLVWAVLISLAVLVSNRMEKQYHAEQSAEFDNATWAAYEVFAGMKAEYRNSVADSFRIDNDPAGPAYSRLSFKTKNGADLVYCQKGTKLFMGRNGKEEAILTNLHSLTFLPPQPGRPKLKVEIRVPQERNPDKIDLVSGTMEVSGG